MRANEKRIIHAVSKLGRRVTAADVVHETGEPLLAVQSELNKLASHTQCVLEVSNTGAVVYVFQPHFARTLRIQILYRKAMWLPSRLWRKAKFLFRISFGIDLIVSLAVSALIVVLISLSSSDGWDFSAGGGGGGGSKGKKKRKETIAAAKSKSSEGGRWQACKLLLFGDPADHSSKGYLDQCFLFLFGEPDPNRNRLERQWESIASLIEQNEGALTFEQIQPWLVDPPSEAGQEKSIFQVLARFDGRPEVTEAGDIVYVFPLLKETAVTPGEKKLAVAGNAWLEEANWEPGDHGKVKMLAGINFLLCMFVYFDLPPIGAIMVPNALGFFVLAGFTTFRLQRANQRTSERNGQRKAFAEKLLDKENQKKIRSARQYADPAIQVDKSDIAYRSDQDLLEQEIHAGANQSANQSKE
jgi:hypothetical protein